MLCGLVAVISIIIATAVTVVFVKRKLGQRPPMHRHNNPVESFEISNKFDKANEDCGDSSAVSFPSDYKISKGKIKIGSIIGSGEFGIVYKGILSDRGDVAVKIPNSADDKKLFKSALAELKILCHIGRHSHVVSFIGAYIDEIGSEKIYIVLEYCGNGPLISYLRRMQKRQVSEGEEFSVDLHELHRFSYEIACGMEYISEKRVIHGDLAARNVLLTDAFTCKIADFGLSRKLYAYNEYVKKRHEPLPCKWMAPESLRNMEFTTKSDVVWSYGVTVWEIFSLGTLPYPGLSWTVNFVDDLDAGMRPGKAQYCSNEIHEKLLECFQKIPEKRPSFGEMANFFATQKETVYLHLHEN